MDGEFGVGGCKLLHLECISNEVLWYSRGSYIQSLGIEPYRRYYEKKNVYTHTHTRLGHFAVQQKLAQYCKSAILFIFKKGLHIPFVI